MKRPKGSVKSLTAKPAFSELSDTVRAQLYTQFNTLERSGIPLLQALPIISGQSPASIQEKLQKLTLWIQKGTSLADAGRRSGVFLSWEARLIGAAEAAGSLQTVFTQLSEHYQARASRLRKLKVRLVYPYAVLIIGLLVLPLPSLAAGDIGPFGYFLRSLLPLLVFFLSTRFLANAYRRTLAGERSGLAGDLLFTIPLIRRQLQRDMLAALAMLLRAGLPALEALELTRDSCAGSTLRGKFVGVLSDVHNGAGVSEALAAADLLEDDYASGLIGTGEAAGRLDGMLSYYVERLDDKLQSQLDMLAEWFPRVVYFVIIGLLLIGQFG
jgi:type II secretory pathway component PulF